MEIIALLAPIKDFSSSRTPLGTFMQNCDSPQAHHPAPKNLSSAGHLNLGHKAPQMTRAFSLCVSVSALLDPPVEPLGITNGRFGASYQTQEQSALVS